jgi:hypothetical protein
MSAAERVVLADGAAVTVRPMTAADRDGLLRAFDRLSDDSRYARFLSPHPRLSGREAAYFTDVDHHDHEALVAIDDAGDGLATARFVRSA